MKTYNERIEELSKENQQFISNMVKDIQKKLDNGYWIPECNWEISPKDGRVVSESDEIDYVFRFTLKKKGETYD